MVSWPSTLPDDVLIEGYREQPPKNVIRTQMDQGPAKVRRRSTTGPRMLRVSLDLTRAQVDTLDSFFRTDLEDGALRFDWTHPRTQAAVQMRFVEPPQYTPLTGADWTAALNLEILP